MQLKKRLILVSAFPILWRELNSRKLGRRLVRLNDDKKYPMPWRNNYLIKKMKLMMRTAGAELTVRGFENIPKNTAILAPNHSSAFDPIVMVLAMENPSKDPDAANSIPVFLGKAELEKNKWIKGWGQINNTFYIDRANPRSALEVIDAMVEHAKEYHKMVVIFPEGTRSKDGKVHEFKGGAFRAAKKHFLPIVPVTINNTPGITDLTRGTKPKHKVEIIFHKPIKPMQFMMMDTNDIAEMVKKQVESAFKAPERLSGEAEAKIAK